MTRVLRGRALGRAAASLLLAGLATALVAGAAEAHVVKDFGPYSVALGWATEPTYVGQINAVQVVVKDKGGKPVTDLADGDLKVVVSIGGQSSNELALDNKFDPDTGLGVPGDYEAPLTPTTPGDYTFHLTGAIHGTAVDETATSSDATFNSAVEATDIQFPNQLPSLAEIATRLDRIDARIANASGAPATPSPATAGLTDAVTAAQASAAAAQASASQAHDVASTALVAGVLVGGVGVILGAVAIAVGLRRPSQA